MSTTVPVSAEFQLETKSPGGSASLARTNVMRASKLFEDFSEAECAPFVALARAQVLARGELLFMQGDPIRRLILVLRGCVTLSQISSQGEQVIVWLAGKGDALGWSDGIAPHVHSCSARTAATCATLDWDLSSMDMLLARYPRLRLNLNRILFNRLQDLEERFCELATASAGRRLALSIIRLAPRVGIPESDGMRIPLSREEIARVSGTCMFTASRILSRWTAEGLIRSVRQGIVILRNSQLRAILESGD